MHFEWVLARTLATDPNVPNYPWQEWLALNSGLAEQVGMTKTSCDSHQTAIVFNVHTQLPHENKAYERFTESGPLAFLPFDSEIKGVKASGNGFSVVWTVETDAAKLLMTLTPDEFTQALQQAFGYRQGKVLRVSELASYPLATCTITGKALTCSDYLRYSRNWLWFNKDKKESSSAPNNQTTSSTPSTSEIESSI